MNEGEFTGAAVATEEPDGFPQQFTVMLKNRVGALASLLKLLQTHSIEVLGLSLQDSRDATMLRLVVSEPGRTDEIFLEKGIPHTKCELIVLGLRDVQGDLFKALEALRAAETNIDFTYALLAQPSGRSLMALHLEDTQFGAEVLRKAGLKVMWQCDLLR